MSIVPFILTEYVVNMYIRFYTYVIEMSSDAPIQNLISATRVVDTHWLRAKSQWIL